MTPCLLALALTAACPGAPTDSIPTASLLSTPRASSPVDGWIAEDKLRHFALSFAATDMVFAGASVGSDPDTALQVAAAAALGLGLAKEVRDHRAGQHFCFKDLMWDAAGVALGVLLVRNIQ
jgi:uncharacterized protein YfiM (DUF2279 family)